MNIHHIGYLVKKGPKAQAAFEALGYIAEGEWTHDEIRKVDILFLKKSWQSWRETATFESMNRRLLRPSADAE